jgi:hypothetical protein
MPDRNDLPDSCLAMLVALTAGRHAQRPSAVTLTGVDLNNAADLPRQNNHNREDINGQLA